MVYSELNKRPKMKNLKTKLGLLFGLFLLATGFLFFQNHKALAFAATTEDQVKNATYAWADAGHIVAHIGGQDIVFVASSSYNDVPLTYKAQAYDCPGKIYFPGFYGAQLWTKAAPNPAKIDIDIKTPTGCGDITGNTLDKPIDNSAMSQALFIQTDANTFKTTYDSYGFGSVNDHPYVKSGDGVYSQSGVNSCADRIVANGGNMVLYELDANRGFSISQATANSVGLGPIGTPPNNCHVQRMNLQDVKPATDGGVIGQAGNTIPYADAATDPTVTGSTGGGVDNCNDISVCIQTASEGDSSACAAGSNTALEWILCPLTTFIGKFADIINQQVEDQLNFPVDRYLPDGGQVNRAWTIIKNVVSGLVVILLLVMVMSQAIGGGGGIFDAYTVKKMLPKLVIAIILMQFSWVLSKWMISSVNDLGTGIKQIMLAPFGGGAHMSLNDILHHLDNTYPAVSNWPVIGLIFLFIKVAHEFILPILTFAITGVTVGLVVAFGSLVFRNMLIIMGVIFAPLALLLWATPGQTMQSYWKKYIDNFSRLLLLFPLMIVMIYAGRITGWVIGNLGFPGIFDYFAVMVAFFLPYFYLPKAFKWGGQIMAGINNAIATNKLTQGGKNWGYGLGKRGMREAQDKAKAAFDPSELGKERFDPNSRLGRGFQGVGLGRLLYKKVDGSWQGRQKPLGKQRLNMYKSGRILNNAINRKDIAAEGKQAKGQTDEAWDEGAARVAEGARQGANSSYSFMGDPEGILDSESFPEGKDKHYGWDAYFSAMSRHMHNGDWRAAEQVAKKMLTHPMFGIYGNRPMALDPHNKLYKTRLALEDEYGLNGIGAFNEDNMHPRDQKWMTRRKQLKAKDNRTPQEEAELGKLNMLYGLRRGDHQPYTKAERKNMKKTISYLKANREWALKQPKEGVLSNFEADGVTPKKEEDRMYFASLAEMWPAQKKGTSTTEVAQGITAINPMVQPDATTRQQHKGWQPVAHIDDLVAQAQSAAADPNSPEARALRAKGIDPANIGNLVNAHYFGETDEQGWVWSDKSSAQTIHGANESFWGWLKDNNARSLKNLQWGYQDYNNLGQKAGDAGHTLLPGLAGLHWFTSGITERQDPQIAQVLSGIISTPSTRMPFNEWFQEAMPTPKDAYRMMRDVTDPNHPERHQFKTQAIHNSKATFKIRDSLGISRDDARPVTDRDIRILEELPRYQVYFPEWTAAHVRFVFDHYRDPTHRPKKVSAFEGEDALPPDFFENPAYADFQPDQLPAGLADVGGIGKEVGEAFQRNRIPKGLLGPITEIVSDNEMDPAAAEAALEAMPELQQVLAPTRQADQQQQRLAHLQMANEEGEYRDRYGEPPDEPPGGGGGGGGAPAIPPGPPPRPGGGRSQPRPSGPLVDARRQAAQEYSRARARGDEGTMRLMRAARQGINAQIRNGDAGGGGGAAGTGTAADIAMKQARSQAEATMAATRNAFAQTPVELKIKPQSGVAPQEVDIDLRPAEATPAHIEVSAAAAMPTPARINVSAPAGFGAFEARAQAVPGAKPMPTPANPRVTTTVKPPVQRRSTGGGGAFGNRFLGNDYEPTVGDEPSGPIPEPLRSLDELPDQPNRWATLPTDGPVENVVTVANGKKRFVTSDGWKPRPPVNDDGEVDAQFGKPSQVHRAKTVNGAQVVTDQTGKILVPTQQQSTGKDFEINDFDSRPTKYTGANVEAAVKQLTSAEAQLAKARQAGEVEAINKAKAKVDKYNTKLNTITASSPNLASHPAAIQKRAADFGQATASKREFSELTDEKQAAESEYIRHANTPNNPQAEEAKQRRDQANVKLIKKVKNMEPGWNDTPELKKVAEEVHLSSKEMTPYTGGPPELKVDHIAAAQASPAAKAMINPALQSRLAKFKQVKQAGDAKVLEAMLSGQNEATGEAIVNLNQTMRSAAKTNPVIAAGSAPNIPGAKPPTEAERQAAGGKVQHQQTGEWGNPAPEISASPPPRGTSAPQGVGGNPKHEATWQQFESENADLLAKQAELAQAVSVSPHPSAPQIVHEMHQRSVDELVNVHQQLQTNLRQIDPEHPVLAEPAAVPARGHSEAPASASRAPERTVVEDMMDDEIAHGHAEKKLRESGDISADDIEASQPFVAPGYIHLPAGAAGTAGASISPSAPVAGNTVNNTYTTVTKGGGPAVSTPTAGPAKVDTGGRKLNETATHQGSQNFNMDSAAGKKFMSELSHRIADQMNAQKKPGEKGVEVDDVRKNLEGSMKP